MTQRESFQIHQRASVRVQGSGTTVDPRSISYLELHESRATNMRTVRLEAQMIVSQFSPNTMQSTARRNAPLNQGDFGRGNNKAARNAHGAGMIDCSLRLRRSCTVRQNVGTQTTAQTPPRGPQYCILLRSRHQDTVRNDKIRNCKDRAVPYVLNYCVLLYRKPQYCAVRTILYLQLRNVRRMVRTSAQLVPTRTYSTLNI